jgi:hypothetical protein
MGAAAALCWSAGRFQPCYLEWKSTMAATPITDPLRILMGSILMSDAAQKIDFYFDSFHVNGPGYQFVALALVNQGSRRMKIRIGHVQRGAGATYDPADNTFDFPTAGYASTPGDRATIPAARLTAILGERMTIVHECTHALRDALGGRLPTSNGPVRRRIPSDEAAAYLAGALFYIFDSGSPAAPPWASDPLFGAAHALAVKMSTQMSYAVTPQDAKTLREAVAHAPLYAPNRNDFYSYNGVKV